LPIADCRLKFRNSEIGNWKSAMTLPTRLNDAGNLTLKRQLAKTDAAQIKLSQIAARSAATFAASVGAHRKLWLAF
jgi:phosphatidate phosphatase PAH1